MSSPKSIKDTIRIYANIRSGESIAFAVYNFEDSIFNTPSGRLFPFAVGLKLSEPPRLNKLNDTVDVSHRYDFRGEPFAAGGITCPEPDSDMWISWAPAGVLRQSLHFMLLECQRRLSGFSVEFEKDWTQTQNRGFRVTPEKMEINPLKRTAIKWLSAWQLPYWEKKDFTGAERFERIQKIAEAYGIEPWGSKSSFNECLSEIKKA